MAALAHYPVFRSRASKTQKVKGCTIWAVSSTELCPVCCRNSQENVLLPLSWGERSALGTLWCAGR